MKNMSKILCVASSRFGCCYTIPHPRQTTILNVFKNVAGRGMNTRLKGGGAVVGQASLLVPAEGRHWLGGGAEGQRARTVFSVLPPIAHSSLPSQPLIPFGRGRNKRSQTPGFYRAGPGASVQVKPRRPVGPWG